MATLFPAFAKEKRPQSNNPNVQRATKKKPKKIRPATYKPYKPKRAKILGIF
jgi:hypothetical protein